MEKKWTYCAVCSIIQIHFVKGVWGKAPNAEDTYAFPGSDVNLTCQTEKKGFLVQMQWSKVTDKLDLIALYHPKYGLHCANGGPCESLVTYVETPRNVSIWTLHLRNMSSSLTGKYECTFTLYPEGARTKIYNLLIQTNVTQDEWRSSHIMEVWINQTLEIPCFQNISSEILSESTFAWLVQEGNGIQEIRITQGHAISNSTLFKDRVKLGVDYTLCLSPVQIHDDDRKFSCHIMVRPGKILRNSITVKVFAKPEISMIVENNSTDVLGERTFTCSLRNVFPTANLTWFTKGGFPRGEKKGPKWSGLRKTRSKHKRPDFMTRNSTKRLKNSWSGNIHTETSSEIYIINEKRKDKSGFLELKSVLTRVFGNKPAQSQNLTIWCTALSPAPGNKVWNISSEKITFSLGSVKPSADPPLEGVTSTLGTQPSPVNSVSPTRYPAVTSTALEDVGASTPNTTPQTSNSSVTTQGFNYSWTSNGKDTTNSASWMPNETYSSSSSGASSTIHGDVFTSTARTFSEVPTTANGSTKNIHIHITGISVNRPKDGMSWPVIVAALLSFCVALFGLGVRKWCQYQKEIMERPPPFKPPPPPVKYTCIQESIGSDLPCHELETL
ncbi:T-cell surface protein tactile isoform X3 [Canis lupus dingo]|uniref:T-cell surface protein tactile isoform X3 n=1 Tax=Canis lupus dingo TaxID=286419 RepID=UPI000DC69314|nr:T-cell surface protein tactile isoform X3 [Canis lupus dingo]